MWLYAGPRCARRLARLVRDGFLLIELSGQGVEVYHWGKGVSTTNESLATDEQADGQGDSDCQSIS